MIYRDWQIQTDTTFLGYLAQCTSPVGQTVRTSDCFQTEQQAISYGRLMVDYLIGCERSRLAAARDAVACG